MLEKSGRCVYVHGNCVQQVWQCVYLELTIPGGLTSRTPVEQTSTARNERSVQVQATPQHWGLSYTGHCSEYTSQIAHSWPSQLALTADPHCPHTTQVGTGVYLEALPPPTRPLVTGLEAGQRDEYQSMLSKTGDHYRQLYGLEQQSVNYYLLMHSTCLSSLWLCITRSIN